MKTCPGHNQSSSKTFVRMITHLLTEKWHKIDEICVITAAVKIVPPSLFCRKWNSPVFVIDFLPKSEQITFFWSPECKPHGQFWRKFLKKVAAYHPTITVFGYPSPLIGNWSSWMTGLKLCSDSTSYWNDFVTHLGVNGFWQMFLKPRLCAYK